MAKQLLREFHIHALGYVVELGRIAVTPQPGDMTQHRILRDQSIVYTLNPDQDEQIKELIDQTGRSGDTLGGIVEVRVSKHGGRMFHFVGSCSRRQTLFRRDS